MKIIQAFPKILEREYPLVKAHYRLLTVLFLLRINDVDAVPILPSAKKRGARAVFGFSSLPLFMTMKEDEFSKFLRGPCEVASDELTLLRVEDDLNSLFRSFESRKLGFALVQDGGNKPKSALVSLADVLGLYAKEAIMTDLQVKDVGNPIFSMSGNTSIHESLKAMFRYRYRRIFISGAEAYISDRSIMSYLFSPLVLEGLGSRGRQDILSTPISEIQKNHPTAVRSDSSLKTAALKLGRERGSCLLTEEKKLVTPWDVAMKPWSLGKLDQQTE